MVITSELNSRKNWIDFAKGLGIVAVVIGHSGSSLAYFLYWFHIPLFFVISGFLFKPLQNRTKLLHWIIKRTRQLILPYISFLIILVVVEFYINNRYFNLFGMLKALRVNLFPGGRYIGGFYTPFWFITCLFTTQIIFALILQVFKSPKTQILIIGFLYVLAHAESWVLKTHQILVPWDIDVAMLTLTYYAIGYYAKNQLKNVSPVYCKRLIR